MKICGCAFEILKQFSFVHTEIKCGNFSLRTCIAESDTRYSSVLSTITILLNCRGFLFLSRICD